MDNFISEYGTTLTEEDKIWVQGKVYKNSDGEDELRIIGAFNDKANMVAFKIKKEDYDGEFKIEFFATALYALAAAFKNEDGKNIIDFHIDWTKEKLGIDLEVTKNG